MRYFLQMRYGFLDDILRENTSYLLRINKYTRLWPLLLVKVKFFSIMIVQNSILDHSYISKICRALDINKRFNVWDGMSWSNIDDLKRSLLLELCLSLWKKFIHSKNLDLVFSFVNKLALCLF